MDGTAGWPICLPARVGGPYGQDETLRAGGLRVLLTTKISGCYLFAGMAHFFGNDEPGFEVGLPLFWGESFAGGATAGRGWPAGELLVACLGVGMAEAMHLAEACFLSLFLILSHFLHIHQVAGNQ